MSRGPRIVVIGGGTGSFMLLSGIKNYANNVTALVNMADNGGSTGQLRDEYGVLPPGDVRQCLAALANFREVRDLFNFRFEDGSLKGHAFGNIFLAALERMTGSFTAGVALASEVLRITGTVEPITEENTTLCMRAADGSVVAGEFEVAHADFGSNRPELWLQPDSALSPGSRKAILEADMVVIAPGSLYGSIAPALLVTGFIDAIQESKAKTVYVCNLVTKPGQTDGFTVADFAAEIERLAGMHFLDYVIYNTSKPSKELQQKYIRDDEFLVPAGFKPFPRRYRTIGADILSGAEVEAPQAGDAIAAKRSLIRHDSDKIARELMKLYFS